MLEAVDGAHESMLAALASGPVYAVNTGAGYLAGTALSTEEQRAHQRNLLLGRAVGGPPYLHRDEVRALLAVRLTRFLSGHAGVSSGLVRFLAGRLADDFVPAVPRRGIGCAGEVIPLSHAFQTFAGVGQVIEADGQVVDAADALAVRGLAPYEPKPKEGIALLAGAPGALALTIARRRTVLVLADQLLVATACAVDAVRAPLAPYSQQVADLAADPVLARVLERLRMLLTDSAGDRGGPQAPVSFRVAPQVLAQLVRTLDRLGADCERVLGGADDSPAFVGGEFVSTGGFHAVELAAALDQLAVVLCQAGELTAQHTHRLLDSRFTGLPDQLTPRPGPGCGLVVVQKRAVGAVNEVRRLAAPASVGVLDTSLGQEDAMTFAFEAAEKLRRVEELVREVVACALLTVRQAWALREMTAEGMVQGGPYGFASAPYGSASTPYAAGLSGVAETLAREISPVDEDRPLGGDIDRLMRLLEAGELRG